MEARTVVYSGAASRYEVIGKKGKLSLGIGGISRKNHVQIRCERLQNEQAFTKVSTLSSTIELHFDLY